ncbi:MAG: glutathione S-transferase N-terminal domain-containing protein [Actinomycetes bacterium]
MTKATLWQIPGSHPCEAVEKALNLKGFDVKTVNLLPVMHKPVQKVVFGQPTVPGVVFEGERVVGSRRIMKRLDEMVAEPALYPADPAARAKVEEAEAWGDDVLQAAVRRLLWAVARNQPKTVLTAIADPDSLPIPLSVAMLSAKPMTAMELKIHGITDEVVREDLSSLGSMLDHADALIGSGVIGGDQPNAADLQILSSYRLLNAIGDFSHLLEGRPAVAAAAKIFPGSIGNVPAGILPADERALLV